MMLIQYPDRETEIKGLAVLMSRFSGKVSRWQHAAVAYRDN
jgi:hypothetical protein